MGTSAASGSRSILSITPVFTSESIPPIGPYSQAIKANNMVFLAGMIPADKHGNLTQGSVTDKTHQMCTNASAVLRAAGSSLEKTVKVVVFFADLKDFKEMNEVYAQYFPHKPARSAVSVTGIPAGASMEMDIIALQ